MSRLIDPMMPFDPTQAVQSAYNFWLGFIPPYLGLGAAGADPSANWSAGGDESGVSAAPNELISPVEQVAEAAAMAERWLQYFAQPFAPILQSAGVPDLMDQWTAWPGFASAKAGEASGPATMATQALFAPWTALMSTFAAAMTNALLAWLRLWVISSAGVAHETQPQSPT
jgi:hypothetical protein